MIDISQLTAEEKAQLIATAKQIEEQEKAQAVERKKSYEEIRHATVTDCLKKVRGLASQMREYHSSMMPNVMAFGELMREFGDMPKKSKGGFSIMNDAQTERVTLHLRKIGEFNELADMAEQHIKDFLEREIKSSSPDAYELIITLLERKKGKIEYSRAMQILQYESKFNDPDWKKGCELLKQSFNITSSKFYLEFEQKNENGSWERIDLNFASLVYAPVNPVGTNA
jgi:hypothetical protein